MVDVYCNAKISLKKAFGCKFDRYLVGIEYNLHFSHLAKIKSDINYLIVGTTKKHYDINQIYLL